MLAFALTCAVALRPAAGAPSGPAKAAAPPPERRPLAIALPIQRHTLDNGLRVVLSVDRRAPAVAVAIGYDAGSRDEPPGRSGVARLLARMMFQGSRNAPGEDHLRLVAERGGWSGSMVLPDRTSFYEVVPTGDLAVALWLEADRMKALDFRAGAFERERAAAIATSAWQGGDVRTLGLSRLAELVFQGYWPYEHPATGAEADLTGAQVRWVREFHAAHYGPNNAVLAVAGDFDAEETLALVRRFFGGIPKISAASFADVPFPEQTSQRTAVVRSRDVRAPGILYGWAIPPLGHPDHVALSLLAVLLGGGEGSRLRDLLVRDKSVARSIEVFTGGRRGPDLFAIDARLTEDARPFDVERLIEQEIKALATTGPSSAELEAAHRLAEAAFLATLDDIASRASALCDHELLFGDARHLNNELARYQAVTRDDVRRVAREHLGPTRRTIVESYPTTPARPAIPVRPGPAHAAEAARPGPSQAVAATRPSPRAAAGGRAPAAKAASAKAPAKASQGGGARSAPKKNPTGAKRKKL